MGLQGILFILLQRYFILLYFTCAAGIMGHARKLPSSAK